jgi:CubicO group peptidase (beta-lactamase class C family)
MLRASAVLAVVVALVGCGPAGTPSGAATPSVSAVPSAPPSAGPSPSSIARLGAFPPLPTTELPADRAAAMQAVLEGFVDSLEAPGMAAAVIAAGRGTWAGAAGTADGTTALDAAAQFGIGSVTKTVIAAQVLRLVESGAVDLDRPIGDYIDGNVPTNGATVRQVLSMRSGIGELGLQARLTEACADLSRSISIADERTMPFDEPFFEPGTQFRYTNSNYLLAGILIEDVTGQPIGEVLRSGVLSAPGLERLIYQDAERPTPPLAAPFIDLGGSEPAPDPADVLKLGDGYLPARCLASAAGPAGGIASDAMTLARWAYLLYGGSILDDAALAQMTAFEGEYGLGVHRQLRFGVTALGHEGSVPGYTAVMLAFPDEGLAIAVLMNTTGSESDLTTVVGRLRDTGSG